MLAKNLGLDRAARREDLLHEASREINAGLNQHWMHDLIGARELSAARRVVAEASAAQAFLVLLVAFLAGLFVAVDFV